MHQKIKCFYLFVFMLAPYSADATHACPRWIAKIVSLEGKVDSQHSGDIHWHTINRKETFCRGDKIRTDQHSRATLLFKNESRATLDQNTTLTFIAQEKDSTAWYINLFEGGAFFRSRQPQRLNIHTPFINAVHEGTEFLVTVDSQQTQISVFDGQVAATNQMGKILIKKGYTGIAGKNQPPHVQALKIKPEDAVQWTLYYPPIMDLQKPEIAKRKDLQAAIKIYQQGNIHQAIVLLDKIPARQHDASYLTFKSSLLLIVGSVDEALNLIDKALFLDPNNSNAFALQSIIAVAKNRQDNALDLAQKAVSLDPESAAAQIALSYAYQSSFNIDSSMEATQKAVQLSPDNALAWARLAELQLSTGERSEALKSAQQAKTLNPELDRTQIILGFAYLTQIDIDEAKTAFNQAIKLNSSDPLARLGLGLAKIRKGNIEEGTHDIESAVSLDPENALMRSYLGKAYYELRNNDYAATELAIAKEMDPNDPTPWFYDAIRKQTTNRPVEALYDMQKAIELNDNRGVYRSKLLLDEDLASRSASLGRIYNDLGFQQLGLLEGWKSITSNPNNHSAHRLLADNYSILPRHEKARVSELLQSQLLQPVNITPIQPRLAESDRLASNNLSSSTFNEYNSLFLRNQFTLQGSGVVGNNDSIGGEIVHAGIWNEMSYSLGAYHFEDDGFRKNNDIKQNIINAFIQHQLSKVLNLQFEFRYNDLKNGDLRQRFDSTMFSSAQRDQFTRKTYRLGANYNPDSRTNYLLSAIYTDEKFEREIKNNKDISSLNDEINTFSIELQYIKDLSFTKVILGGGYSDTNRPLFTNQSFNIRLPPFPPFFIPKTQQIDINTSTDIDTKYSNAYLYSFTTFKNMNGILGVSFDSIQNHTLGDIKKVNPKIGLLWQIFDTTTLRLAYFHSLMGVSGLNQTIEPIQIAGFVQSLDDAIGTRSKRLGIGLDHKFSKSFFGGIEGSYRKLKIPKFSFPVTNIDPFGSKFQFNLSPSSIFNESQNEFFFRSYLNWTPTKLWALSLDYQFKINDKQVQKESIRSLTPDDIKTHQIPISIRYFLPNGFYSKLKATFVDQQLKSNSPFNNGDRFWTFDTILGYRFPKRYGKIELSAKNLFNENYQYEDINFTTGLPTISTFLPERTVSLQLIIDFGL